MCSWIRLQENSLLFSPAASRSKYRIIAATKVPSRGISRSAVPKRRIPLYVSLPPGISSAPNADDDGVFPSRFGAYPLGATGEILLAWKELSGISSGRRAIRPSLPPQPRAKCSLDRLSREHLRNFSAGCQLINKTPQASAVNLDMVKLSQNARKKKMHYISIKMCTKIKLHHKFLVIIHQIHLRR